MEKRNIRDARLKIMMGVFFAHIFIILIRLFYLQVVQNKTLGDLGEKNFLRSQPVVPLRGNLFDCNGVLLAANKPIFDVSWQGIDGGGGSGSILQQIGLIHEEILSKLGVILDVDFFSPEKLEGIKVAQRFCRRCLLKREVTFEQVCQISEKCGHSPYIVVENRFERVYPYKSLASHALGYLSRVDRTGQDGLEKAFQKELSGQPGYSLGIFNAMGKKLEQREFHEAQSGKDLTLTLDVNLQLMAETFFDKWQVGSLIVMDPADGAIKVIVSSPNIDPNLFLTRITSEEWSEKCLNNNPLLNRATNAVYPPASIFKLVTITAGLEEGIIDTNSVFECRGHVTFRGRRYLCQRHWGHGLLATEDSIAYSCNVHSFEIAKHLNIDVLAGYARRFGLGCKTNFLLPEKPGLVPSSGWKKENKGEPWWPGETLSAAIGQSFNLVTPLQIVRMIGAIGTGSLVKPRILQEEPVERERLEISERTRLFLRQAMHQAVEKGSCKCLKDFKLKDFYICAKTGTAQTCDLNIKKTDRKFYDHAWMTGFFRYKKEPPLAMVVLLEHAGASLNSVLLAKKFLIGYAALKEGKTMKPLQESIAQLNMPDSQEQFSPMVAHAGIQKAKY
ncbi:MAG: penicillin-binding transpeptidase domain-containing protein [bacterium]